MTAFVLHSRLNLHRVHTRTPMANYLLLGCPLGDSNFLLVRLVARSDAKCTAKPANSPYTWWHRAGPHVSGDRR